MIGPAGSHQRQSILQPGERRKPDADLHEGGGEKHRRSQDQHDRHGSMIFRDRVVDDPAVEGCEQRQRSRGIGIFDFDFPQLDQQWLAIGADALAKAIGSIEETLRLKLDVPERA